MKYLPLVWAGLWRKKMRAVMTLLAVTVAFTLFGLMIGLSTTVNLVEQRARADRVFSGPRYAPDMPSAMARQIARMPGVKAITSQAYINGYVADPKNRTFVVMTDANLRTVFPEWIPARDFAMLRANRTGVVMSQLQATAYHKKVGDSFTIISPQTVRADGAKSWTFTVVAICPDLPQATIGFNFANYDYFDKSLPLSGQGKIMEVDLIAANPDQSSAISDAIDRTFASSGTPTASITEKAAYAVGNNFGGLDVNALTADIALAGLAMILFLTANVIAQSVRERFPEFAALKTIGFTDSKVVTLVVLEALAPCLLGAVLGVGAAALLGRQLPNLMPAGFGLPPPTLSASVFLLAAGAALVMAIASAALPAFRLSRMDIAAALSGRS
jgi:putative ABC transport system permease protein